MATQPTTPPSVTAWPTSPSRARPSTFATEADAFLGHFPIGQADQQNLVNWLNTTAGQSYTNALEAAASATAASASEDAAAQSVIDANSILSSAFSQANYKGLWSSLSGALNIPASVLHNGGLWLLTTNIANVAASTPSETNPNWFLVFRKATDLDVENGTQYANPDAKQLKGFVQRNWEDLTTAKSYNESCFYNSKEYVVRNPLTDPTIAPPSTAGRSYFEFDGVDGYITIPTITLQAGDVVKFKFRAPTSAVSTDYVLTDDSIDSGASRLSLSLNTSGLMSLPVSCVTKINNIVQSASSKYPTDGLVYDFEIQTNIVKYLAILMANRIGSFKSKGRIYDLEVIRSGTRIHYYPLRTDAVDYLAGNLVKDEEFTYSGNWTYSASTTYLSNNSLIFDNTASLLGFYQTTQSTFEVNNSYRIVFEVFDYVSGSVTFEITGDGIANSSTIAVNGKYDIVYTPSETATGTLGFITRSANTSLKIKNFRVIKLNELSPSASFSSATGFTLAGGVTITGGQAVFGSGAGTKAVRNQVSLPAGTKVRVKYKFNGRTTGGLVAYSVHSNGLTEQINSFNYTESAEIEVIEYTLLNNSDGIGLRTPDGWNGNVEYFSVTEVTDGTENGSPVKTFDKHWQLTSGEQFLPSSAGLVKFGDNLAIDSNNTLEIEPLANGSRGDTIKLARKEGFAPIVKLSATDISAGKLIRYGVQTDAELTLDSNDVATLIHNGVDLEFKRG